MHSSPVMLQVHPRVKGLQCGESSFSPTTTNRGCSKTKRAKRKEGFERKESRSFCIWVTQDRKEGVGSEFGLISGSGEETNSRKLEAFLRGQAAIQAAWRKTNRVTFFAKVQEWRSGRGRPPSERTSEQASERASASAGATTRRNLWQGQSWAVYSLSLSLSLSLLLLPGLA